MGTGSGASRPVDRARAWLGFTAASCLLARCATGLLLAWRYTPDDPLTGSSSQDVWTQALDATERPLTVLTVVAVTGWAVVSTVAASGIVRRVLTGVAGALVVLGALASSFAWSLVLWDQIALRSVQVGTEFTGLWSAAFSDEVRFVLVDGAEVSQATFARWVVVAVVAPFLTLVVLAIGWACSRRPGSTLDAGRVAGPGATTADATRL